MSQCRHLIPVVVALCGPLCAAAEPQLFWGDTHLHTSNSGDAFFSGNLTVSPDDAYRFASGEPMVHPGHGVRVQLSEPLDFLVIADHAEYLGVPRFIYEEGVPREELSFWQKLFVPAVEWWYRRSMDGGGSAVRLASRCLFWLV